MTTAATAAINWIFTGGSSSAGAAEGGSDLVQEAGELSALIPGREPKPHVADAGLEVCAKLGDALGRAARHGPALDEAGAELRRVVGVEERLALLEAGLPVLVDIDVVVERAAEPRGGAALL